jgi:predicted SprT family Zn-dependent metalloprotease
MKPTQETYTLFSQAYDYFNKVLFNDKLTSCVITMQRKKGAYGYFWGDTWGQTHGDTITDEIALNPDSFKSRSDKEVLSTLVHEMTHLEQHHFGTPSRNGYHNKEWSKLMEAVGLIPSDTGEEGGKKTGQKMTHYVEPGGLFEMACEKLITSGFSIPWQALTRDLESAAKKRASKTKYTCMSCNTNAWAKPDTNLMCGDCEIMMIPDES